MNNVENSIIYIRISEYMSSKLHIQKSNSQIAEQAEFFKQLSDPTRLGLLHLLKDGEAKCVCDLVEALDIPQPTVSRHLGKLKSAGLVTAERRGTWIWYALNDGMPEWTDSVLQMAFANLNSADANL